MGGDSSPFSGGGGERGAPQPLPCTLRAAKQAGGRRRGAHQPGAPALHTAAPLRVRGSGRVPGQPGLWESGVWSSLGVCAHTVVCDFVWPHACACERASVFTRVNWAVDEHTHEDGQGSPPEQGCLEGGIGGRPGAPVLALFPLLGKSVSLQGPHPGAGGRVSLNGKLQGTARKSRWPGSSTQERGLAYLLAARVPAQPGFLPSRGRQASLTRSVQRPCTQRPAEGSAEPPSGLDCSLLPERSRGSSAGATTSDGPKEWDLSSEIQILLETQIQKLGQQGCLGKACRVGYHSQDLTFFPCTTPSISLKPDAL